MKLRITLTALALAAVIVPTAAQAAYFADIRGHWAEGIINNLANAGVVSGVSDTEFNPDASVTRAEFLRMAMEAGGIETAPCRAGECLDVSGNEWYAPYVQGALDKGLIPEGMIDGYSVDVGEDKVTVSGAFNCATPIKREEMAYLTQAVYQYGLGEVDIDKLEAPMDLLFDDVRAISVWALDGVKYAYMNELIFGMGDGNFAPQSTATRAQAASIINNLLTKRGV